MKLYLCLFLCLFTIGAGAVTFCVKPDVIALGISSLKIPTVTSYSGFDWSAYVPEFGTIHGISSCSDKGGDNSVNLHGCRIGSYWGHVAAKGEDVNNNYYGRADGKSCWCKMTHPVESGWILVHIYTDVCVSDCAKNCGNYLKSTSPDHASTLRCMLATVGLEE